MNRIYIIFDDYFKQNVTQKHISRLISRYSYLHGTYRNMSRYLEIHVNVLQLRTVGSSSKRENEREREVTHIFV